MESSLASTGPADSGWSTENRRALANGSLTAPERSLKIITQHGAPGFMHDDDRSGAVKKGLGRSATDSVAEAQRFVAALGLAVGLRDRAALRR